MIPTRLHFTSPSGDSQGITDAALPAAPAVGDLIWYSRERNGKVVHCWRVTQRMFQQHADGSYAFEVVLAPIQERS